MNILLTAAIAAGTLLAALGGGALTYRTVKSQKPLESYVLSEGSGPERVLIATHRTKFKDSVLEKLGSSLSGFPARIEVADAAGLGKAAGYDKIVVFSAVQSGKLLPPVAAYLGSRADFRNLDLVLTADSGKWKAREFEIDAVVSASRAGNEDAAVRALDAAVRAPVR